MKPTSTSEAGIVLSGSHNIDEICFFVRYDVVGVTEVLEESGCLHHLEAIAVSQ